MTHAHPARAHMDFETRSACSIRDCGSWRYSLDPTTEVLCLAFRLPHWASGRTGLWHPAFPHLDLDENALGTGYDDLSELFGWLMTQGLIEAHNAWFERGIWTNICAPLYGWPTIAPDQWRCSAAKAAAHSLARNLEDAGEALELDHQKDLDGAVTMKKMAKPRNPNKADWKNWRRHHDACPTCFATGKIPAFKKDGSPAARMARCPTCQGTGHGAASVPPMPLLWHESRDLLERLFAYCRCDVLAEEDLSNRLPDLNEAETLAYLTDQTINERGVRLDRDALDAALALIDEENAEYNRELCTITDGAVERATQRQRLLRWLAANGFELSDTQADTVDAVLARQETGDEPPWAPAPTGKVRRALELQRALGKSSTAKYEKAMDWLCPDGRVHGSLLYHGAGTGRWSGQGVQPQNFPRGTVKITDINRAWDVIKQRDRGVIESTDFTFGGKKPSFGGVMDVLSSALRGIIIASPGNELFVADYAAIEARCVLWQAEDNDGLDVFRRREDIYCEMATSIFGRPITKEDPERQLGKAAILGLGYQMGPGKFVESAANYGVTLVEDATCVQCGLPSREHRKVRTHDFECANPDEITAVKVVDAFREKFWRIKDMWWAQEDAAIKAMSRPGRYIPAGRMLWIRLDDFLYCELPSGRRLAYPDPEVHERQTPWGEPKPSLTYMGINTYTRKWCRQTAYGGMFVENQTQAVARDLMMEAMMRAEHSGLYLPILTVHDELIAEAPIGRGDVKEFEALMAAIPEWADGCPVEAEGWSGPRYRK